MRHISFSKNCANTETHSFADIYAIRILDKGNNHSLPALLQLPLVPYNFPLHYTNFPLPHVLNT